MPTLSERLTTAVAQIEADVTKHTAIVEGPATGPGSTVTTDNGPVKTAAAKILEIEERADDIYVARQAAQDAQAGAELAQTAAEAAAAQAAINAALANQAVVGYARVAAVANSAISGLLTIDGLTLVAGDVVLLTAQSTAHQNGPWVAASGSWTRPTWYAAGNNTQAAFGAGITVNGTGVVTGNSVWRLTSPTSGAVTIGTTSTSWTRSVETTVTQAATVNDTRTASTAFVQAVANAGGSRTSSGTLSTAGNTDLAAATAQNRRRFFEVTIGAGSGAFTRTLAALTANAQSGDELEISVSMPASLNPTVELRNNTSGGTLLATVPTDAAVARVWSVWSRYNGTAWGAATLAPLSAREYVSTYVDPIGNGREAKAGLYFDGSKEVPFPCPALGSGDWSIAWDVQFASTTTSGVVSFGADQGIFTDSLGTVVTWGYSSVARSSWTCDQNGHFVLTKSGNTLELYRNGASQGQRTLTSASVSAGSYLGAYNATVPAAFFTGVLRVALPYNYQMTAAQVRALYRDGQPDAIDREGSATSLSSGNFSNTGYITFSGGSPTGFSAAKPIGGAEGNALSSPVFRIRTGQSFKVSFTLTLNSGALPNVLLSNGAGGYVGSQNASTVVGANNLILVSNRNDLLALLRFYTNAGDAADYVISALSITPLGTFCQYDFSGAGPQIKDTNGTTPPRHINLPDDGTTGGVVRVPASVKPFTVTEDVTASGYALGRDAPIAPVGYRLRAVWYSGNGTFSLGNAASGTEILNAVTATATETENIPTTRITSSRKFYRTLGTATALHITYEFVPLI